MSEQNSCAKLMNIQSYNKAEKLYYQYIKDKQSPMQIVFDLQKELQIILSEKLPKYNINPNNLVTMGDILDWVRKNENDINSEFCELYNNMGQISKGEKVASTIWKRWKVDHEKFREIKYIDFSDNDKLELMFEYIDILHFFINIGIALGFNAKEMIIMYILKQEENIKRYNTKY